jgi:hypothetical protein
MRATSFPSGAVSLALCAFLLAAPAAQAETTFRVDDSGTVVNQPVLQMQWRKLVPSRAGDNMVDGQVRVALRLNLAQWLNKPVRLYMALAPVNSDPVQASWRTQGRLLSGTVRSGGRSLIYNGPVTAAILEETIDLTLTTDGRNLVSAQSLQFYFEADLP